MISILCGEGGLAEEVLQRICAMGPCAMNATVTRILSSPKKVLVGEGANAKYVKGMFAKPLDVVQKVCRIVMGRLMDFQPAKAPVGPFHRAHHALVPSMVTCVACRTAECRLQKLLSRHQNLYLHTYLKLLTTPLLGCDLLHNAFLWLRVACTSFWVSSCSQHVS